MKTKKIFVKPSLGLIQMVGTVLNSLVSTFLSQYPFLIISSTTLVSIVLLFSTLKKSIRPSKVNAFKASTYLFISWCSICGIVASFLNDRESWLPLMILAGGFAVTIIAWIGIAAGFIKPADKALEAMANALGVVDPLDKSVQPIHYDPAVQMEEFDGGQAEGQIMEGQEGLIEGEHVQIEGQNEEDDP